MAPASIALIPGVELCLLEVEQAERIFEVVERNRAHLREFLPWVDVSKEVGATRGFLENHVKQRKHGQTFGYSIWEQERIVGMIDAHAIDAINHQGAVGYWLEERAQGRGLVTEATRRMLDVAFGEYGLERMEIRCAVDNVRSSRVPERLGFTFEGILRHSQLLNGRFVDLKLYSLLRSEFEAGRTRQM